MNKQFKSCRNESGFTLTELMIALALSLFLIGGVVLMHSSGKSTTIDSEQLSRLQENVRIASDYMIRDIRNAGFRDELELTVNDWALIGEQYAAISNGGSTLTIRYGGRGTCVEAFDTFKLVENQYFFDAETGELTCRGLGGGTERAEGLVSGLNGVSFQMICPDGSVNCTCNVEAPEPCLGVRVGLEFDGLRDPNNPGSLEQRSVELTAAFRNSILQEIYRPQ